jgi:2-polyprenyl-3-methyl-5-hydroxy-6-metoxy-1,4-benzoquinol methylase
MVGCATIWDENYLGGSRTELVVRTMSMAVDGSHRTQSELVPRPGLRVLDIGCGPGDLIDYLPSVV